MKDLLCSLVFCIIFKFWTKNDFVTAVSECAPRKYNYSSVVCVCNATYCDFLPNAEASAEGSYQLYTTNEAGQRFQTTTGNFSSLNSSAEIVFKVDRTKTFQKILGFGGAFTDSAGINIKSLGTNLQDFLIRSYFSREGIRYNFGRVPIAGTDFSTRKYSYDDGEADDPLLSNFSLQAEDYLYKMPLMKQAQAVSDQELLFFAAAWDAPDWMKTNFSLKNSGFIKDEYYQQWADYHIRFLKGYADENFTFWAISTGNEPNIGLSFDTGAIMAWTAPTQSKWLSQNLGPTIRNSTFNPLILAVDDERLIASPYLKLVLQNPDAVQFIDGIGIHWYNDKYASPELLEEIHATAPTQFLLYTEASIGQATPSLGSWEGAEMYAEDIIQNLQHWVAGWVDWNLALNLKGGPTWAGTQIDASIITNAEAGKFYKQPMWYAIGHFSKFIDRGAVIISVTPHNSHDVMSIGVQNPDGGICIVFLNKRSSAVNITITDSSRGSIDLTLSEKSICTLMYW